MTERPALPRRTEVESLRHALARLVRAMGGSEARADAPLDRLLMMAASAAIRCEREEFPPWEAESHNNHYRRVVRARGACDCGHDSCAGEGCPACAVLDPEWPCPRDEDADYPRVFRPGDPDPGGDFAVEDEHGDVWIPSTREVGGDRLWITPETKPFPWPRVLDKWGPLIEITFLSLPRQRPVVTVHLPEEDHHG